MPTIISGMNPVSIYSTELNYMRVVTLSGNQMGKGMCKVQIRV